MIKAQSPLSRETVQRADVSVKLRRSRIIKQNIPLMAMFMPVILFYIVFKYIPMLGLVIAFKDYNFFDGIMGSEWVGFKHFKYLFENNYSREIIYNTMLLSCLRVFVGFPFPILLAIMMNEVRKLWFRKSVQTLVYLPHFLSWIIVGGIVVTVFAEQTGIVNGLMKLLGFSSYAFLYHDVSWVSIFVGSGIWKEAGFSAIIYLASLTTIDPSLYEAANMDGAGKWRKIWHVTLPGIRPTIILMLILSMGHVMEVGFDHVYVLQNQVVSQVSEVISTYIFKIGLQGANFSVTAAMGLFESLIGIVLVAVTNRIARAFGQGLW
ncbi:putative aldouronate transport system permease protein [Paenibacillus sp. 1_12]|uniref:ABC transporter permease n=1 Tax=Paenibacillus sp. 1_12 TaxID=1566278 RepID=UPI0008E3EAC3|nr:ABC transporter permease subunit [Paenibacillus sp. 1_12]SFM17636.1 putative aldouronate transport system permease protein [Paenibacillus sp. 1_12]